MPDGWNLIIGQNNTGDATTKLTVPILPGAVANDAFMVENKNGLGIVGIGSGASSGVTGQSPAGTGVIGTSTSGIGVRAVSSSNIGLEAVSATGIGVQGNSSSSTGVEGNSPTGTGVKGKSTSGIGVQGNSTSSKGVEGRSGSGSAVFGNSNSGVGVAGVSTDNMGVVGVSGKLAGVFGVGVSGNTVGIAGFSETPAGVYGASRKPSTGFAWSSSATAAGVWGESVKGPGVKGTSTDNAGVSGKSTESAAVVGSSTKGMGVYGVSGGTPPRGVGVYGYCKDGPGVAGSSTTSAGISGTSSQERGVGGSSTTGRGVVGLSRDSDGVYGQSTNSVGVVGLGFSNKPGVIGLSVGGVGVSGRGPKGWGVVGEGHHMGVDGSSVNGIGVYGSSVNWIGVYGSAVRGPAVKGDADWQNGLGVEGTGMWGVIGTGRAIGVKAKSDHYGILTESDGGLSVYAITKTGTAISAWAQDPKGTAGSFSGKVSIYSDLYVGGPTILADLKVQGDLDVFGNKNAAVKIADGSYRRLYSLESPESWFEDFGRARLARGRIMVSLDRTFANVVRINDYHVFLTLEGKCNGLYVSKRTPRGFEVRELGNGRSNAGFSYRIVARRRDINGRRFEKVTVPPPIDRRAEKVELGEAPRKERVIRRPRLRDLPKPPVFLKPEVISRPAPEPAGRSLKSLSFPKPPSAVTLRDLPEVGLLLRRRARKKTRGRRRGTPRR